MSDTKSTPILDELSKAGHSLLDTVEKALFGRVGGAEAAASALDQSPIEKLRADAALLDEARADSRPSADTRAAREARAAAELEALKARNADPSAPPEPKKRTL